MNALYEATVLHVRRRPEVRTFTHRFYLWYVDLDALPPPRVLARFDVRDHGERGHGYPSIRAELDAWLATHGVQVDRVMMLAAARVAGYVFNPLSVYWCYAADGSLACVVAEVHNTYGGRHRYLVHPSADGSASTEKRLYVSPFITVDGTYTLRVPEPGERLNVSIVLHQDNGVLLSAVLRGHRRPATRRELVRLALRYPLAPLVASAAIKLRGIALWLRGLPVVPRPVVEEVKWPQ